MKMQVGAGPEEKKRNEVLNFVLKGKRKGSGIKYVPYWTQRLTRTLAVKETAVCSFNAHSKEKNSIQLQ